MDHIHGLRVQKVRYIVITDLIKDPTKYQRLVIISADYLVKYCVRNSHDKTRCIYWPYLLRNYRSQALPTQQSSDMSF